LPPLLRLRYYTLQLTTRNDSPHRSAEATDSRLTRLRDWPHAPIHQLTEAGVFMVTSRTYQKAPFFQTSERLTFLSNSLIEFCERYTLDLQAWSVFPNHYHFIAHVPQPRNLKRLQHLHSTKQWP